MNENKRRNLTTLKVLFLAVLVGVLAGAGVYQAEVKGYLPISKGLLKFQNNSSPTSQSKIETVVQEQNAIIDVVNKTSLSVVAIGSTTTVVNPFDPFAPAQQQQSTIGTGFVVSDKGIIVTNRHVVSDENAKYTVVTKDGKKFSVSKIYRDPVYDLAVVQVDGNLGLPALDMGDSSKLQVGQMVVAIGNALGQFTNTVTTGIVSGLGRKVVAGDPSSGSSESLDNLIQTDAAINPGNSGGPLLNLDGQVIGVNVATTQGAQNIGFAIPINSVKSIVDQFVATGRVSRPFLGIQYQFISRDMGLMYQLPMGAYVRQVISDSPADKAGIQQEDVITKIDGKAISDEQTIPNELSNKKVGDTVNLEVWRNGDTKKIDIVLGDLPNQ